MSGNKSKIEVFSLSVYKNLMLLRKLQSGCSASVFYQEYGVKNLTVSNIRKWKDVLLEFLWNYFVIRPIIVLVVVKVTVIAVNSDDSDDKE